MEEQKLYQQRFDDKAQAAKNKLWQELCRNFFAHYVSKDDVVLDAAAGFCEFINNIRCRKKIAVDINPDVSRYANADVQVIQAPSTDLSVIPNGSVNVVFVSNFFEHITKMEIQKTIKICYKMLMGGGVK